MDATVRLLVFYTFISSSWCVYFGVSISDENDTVDAIIEEKPDFIEIPINDTFIEEKQVAIEEPRANTETYQVESETNNKGRNTTNCRIVCDVDRRPHVVEHIVTETDGPDDLLNEEITEGITHEIDRSQDDKEIGRGNDKVITPVTKATTTKSQGKIMVRVFNEDTHGTQTDNKQTTTETTLHSFRTRFPEQVATKVSSVMTTQRMDILENTDAGRSEKGEVFGEKQKENIKDPIGSMEEVNGIKQETFEIILENIDGMIKYYPPGVLKDISGEDKTVCLPQGRILGKRRIGDIRVGM